MIFFPLQFSNPKDWQHSACLITKQRAFIVVLAYGLFCIDSVYLQSFLREAYCYLFVIACTQQLNLKVEFLFLVEQKKFWVSD